MSQAHLNSRLALKDVLVLPLDKEDKRIKKYNFFKTWTPEMAYTLGLIYTDGCITSNDHALSIQLQERDSAILETIKTLIGFKCKILTDKRDNSKMLRISSKDIYNDMLSLGLSERKSLTLQFPNVIPDELLSDFIRGVVDGDGSVHDSNKTLRISICGAPSFIGPLYDKVCTVLDIPKGKLCKLSDTLCQVTFSGRYGFRVGEWIYKDELICFERKHNKYKECRNKFTNQYRLYLRRYGDESSTLRE